MTEMIWLGVGAVVVLGGAAWAFLRGGGGGGKDLGTISGQWIAEHRSHERDSDHR